jgi:hypothetical protein
MICSGEILSLPIFFLRFVEAMRMTPLHLSGLSREFLVNLLRTIAFYMDAQARAEATIAAA